MDAIVTPLVINEEIDSLNQLLNELNNRSAVVLHYINQDLSNDYKSLLMLRSEAGELRIALKAVSHIFGRLHKKYVSAVKDGEESARIPDEG